MIGGCCSDGMREKIINGGMRSRTYYSTTYLHVFRIVKVRIKRAIMEYFIHCKDSHAAKNDFFTQMERQIGLQFSLSEQCKRDPSQETAALNDLDDVSHDVGNFDDSILRRNSFDTTDLCHNHFQIVHPVRPTRSATDLLEGDAEAGIDPAYDMGHLSRRVWIGTTDADTSDRSFGVRRAYNRGNHSRSCHAEDDMCSTSYRWKSDTASIRQESNDSNDLSLSHHCRGGSSQSPCGPIIVSPETVSRCIAGLVYDVMMNGVGDIDVGMHLLRRSNEPTYDTSFIVSKPKDKHIHTETDSTRDGANGSGWCASTHTTVTGEDYDVFRGKTRTGQSAYTCVEVRL